MKKYNPLNSAKNANREEHFKLGGTPRQWLPYKQIVMSKKYKKIKHKKENRQENE